MPRQGLRGDILDEMFVASTASKGMDSSQSRVKIQSDKDVAQNMDENQNCVVYVQFKYNMQLWDARCDVVNYL